MMPAPRLAEARAFEIGRPNRYTGAVAVARLLAARDDSFRVYEVRFEAGSRTVWHAHAGEQWLIGLVDVCGREHEESSQSTSRREAEKILARRQAELAVGQLTAPDAKRVTFTDLAQMIRDDYKVRGRRSIITLEGSLTNLEAFFGACRALAITSDRITTYERERLAAGAARATVNQELAALRRAFNLAVKARRLSISAKTCYLNLGSAKRPHRIFRGSRLPRAACGIARALAASIPVCLLDGLAVAR